MHIQNNTEANNQQNEIKQFIDGRYISACESAWRMFKFPIQGHGPVVGRLSIHLENRHSVTYNPTETNINEILNRNLDTTLLAWFKLNNEDINARQYLYTQIPNYYSFSKQTRKWNIRRTPDLKLVTRIYGVHAKDKERFALRLILNNVPGASSYAELRTINGILYDTFCQAATVLGLLENSEEAIICLNEAYLILSSAQRFREFFCHFIINCSPDISIIWNEFKERLSEDFLYTLRISLDDMLLESIHEVHLFGLIEIQKILRLEGYSLNQFPEFPPLTNQIIEDLHRRFQFLINNNIIGHEAYDQSSIILNTNLPLLNTEQRIFYNEITGQHDTSKF